MIQNRFKLDLHRLKCKPIAYAEITECYQANGFFRCSKSMSVNLHSIASLKSCTDGRIVASLSNGERILIFRQYSRLLRNKLKGGKL